MVTFTAFIAPTRSGRAPHANAARQRAIRQNGIGMDGPLVAGVIAVVLKGYPRLSETFIAQELLALERRGLTLALYSLRRPTDPEAHPVHADIRAPVTYLPEYLHHDPARVWRAWRAARRLPGYRAARATWWQDSAARPHPRARAPFRAGARAGGRAAARDRASARALPPHAGIGHPLRGDPARTQLELLGARERRLDDAGLGEAGKARRVRVGDDLHRRQCAAPARARRLRGPGRPHLSRHRHGALSRAGRRAPHARRQRSRAPGVPSSRWAEPSTRRASTISCAPLPRSRPRFTGGSSTSVAVRCCSGSRTRRTRSASPIACIGRARNPMPRCSPRIARPTSSPCHAA